MSRHAAEKISSGAIFPPGCRRAAAVLAVAATYFYFLIFAQFGLLRALTAIVGIEPARVRPFMMVMGLAGIAGSGLMAWWFRPSRVRFQLAVGYFLAGLAAGLTGLARSPAAFYLITVLTGLGTGMITVGLAAQLRRAIGGERLGLGVGAGTGLAYALCNLPPVFTAEPATQSLLALAAAVVGLLAVLAFAGKDGTHEQRVSQEDRSRTLAGWVMVLFALVAFDSAVFYHLQHTPTLQAATWSGNGRLWLIAGAHLLAGLGGGLALDRWRMGVVAQAGAGLLLAATGLIFTGYGSVGAPLYAGAVSLYSLVLVYFPASRARVGLAALVYAVAGWMGTALGVGLAVNWP